MDYSSSISYANSVYIISGDSTLRIALRGLWFYLTRLGWYKRSKLSWIISANNGPPKFLMIKTDTMRLWSLQAVQRLLLSVDRE